MKPMLWYCFASANVALVMCVVIAAAVFLDGGGGKQGPRSDPRGRDLAATDPAPTASAPSYELRARTAPVVGPDPGQNATPADGGGRPDDDRQSGTTAMKIGTEVLCPRRTAPARETTVDRLRVESQVLSTKTRGLEARLTKMLQDKDANASIAKVDVEALVVLLQRERSYLKCLEQLP